MANNIIEFVLIHDHKCAHENEQYTYRPICRAGTYEDVKIICIETGLMLSAISAKRV